jgi:hypothetical protein
VTTTVGQATSFGRKRSIIAARSARTPWSRRLLPDRSSDWFKQRKLHALLASMGLRPRPPGGAASPDAQLVNAPGPSKPNKPKGGDSARSRRSVEWSGGASTASNLNDGYSA